LKTPFDEKISTNPRSKLTEVEVKEIKQLLKQGVMQKVIAERFNIAKTVISRISTGDIWKDLN
jgi:DNA-binding NarL/FixJ family response regulator